MTRRRRTTPRPVGVPREASLEGLGEEVLGVHWFRIELDVEESKEKEVSYEWEKLNENRLLWMLVKQDVTEEEFPEFCENISKHCLDPLAYPYFHVEGEIESKSILYLLKKAPFDVMDSD